jgi:disulfide bond formation protein DsbB
VTHSVIVALSVLGVVGQVLCVCLGIAALARLLGWHAPLDTIRSLLWGYELWAAFVVSAVATGGSLVFSEIANYVPCELCWFQRICMYPLSIATLLMALRNDHRAAVYLLPLPVVGAAISTYHLLVENRIVDEAASCRLSAPGGCATKWIEEFGYMTIPMLTLTAFVLTFAFLLLAVLDAGPEAEGRHADA